MQFAFVKVIIKSVHARTLLLRTYFIDKAEYKKTAISLK